MYHYSTNIEFNMMDSLNYSAKPPLRLKRKSTISRYILKLPDHNVNSGMLHERPAPQYFGANRNTILEPRGMKLYVCISTPPTLET